jgi:hypothetical protein
MAFDTMHAACIAGKKQTRTTTEADLQGRRAKDVEGWQGPSGRRRRDGGHHIRGPNRRHMRTLLPRAGLWLYQIAARPRALAMFRRRPESGWPSCTHAHRLARLLGHCINRRRPITRSMATHHLASRTDSCRATSTGTNNDADCIRPS